MTRETVLERELRALEESLKKWDDMVVGLGVDRGGENCACCKLVEGEEDDCAQCPIYRATADPNYEETRDDEEDPEGDPRASDCGGIGWRQWLRYMLNHGRSPFRTVDLTTLPVQVFDTESRRLATVVRDNIKRIRDDWAAKVEAANLEAARDHARREHAQAVADLNEQEDGK